MPPRPALLPSASPWAVLLCLATFGGAAILSAPAHGSDRRRTPIVEVVEAVRPSVVSIKGEKTLGASGAQVFEGETVRRVNGMGTGVVIDPAGYIITNHHVIEGVIEILVTTSDEQQYTARLISRDPATDLAIIKIDAAEPLSVIQIGTSRDLMPGEPVVAVGNAYGYENTVTRGIISALHRAVQVSDAQYYDDLIQTDASINPGNSGGPLLNIDGEMIGINVAVRAGAQGIGFAIPVDKAVNVAAELLAAHARQKAWHGVELETGAPRGGSEPVVRSVADKSPAEEAGLESGDVITRIGDLEIERALDFHRAIMDLDAGQSTEIAIRRGDETLNLTLTLANIPGRLKPAIGPYWDLLGVELEPIPDDEFRQSYRTRYRGGLSVTAVRPKSPAAGHGIRSGDVLVGMHVWETISLKNVDYVVDRVLKQGDSGSINPVKFYILRGSETLYGYLPIPLAMRKTVQR